MGIVHHAAYVVWLEEGRSHWLRANNSSYAEFEKDGVSLAVSELDVRYIRATQYDQLVKVRCWIEEVKSRKITFAYEVFDVDSGNILVRAWTRHICVNTQGQVTKIPEKWQIFMSR